MNDALVDGVFKLNMDTLIGLFEGDSRLMPDLFRSALMIAALVILRAVLLRTVISNNQKMSIDTKRRWSVNLRNAVIFCSAFGLLIIWAQELQNFALSIVAFAAALVLATKELIMCVSGGLLRAMSNSYTLGDHIEVGVYRGRVVDINLFSTAIMEIGPNHKTHQMTGRALHMPNSLLLTFPVIRDNHMGRYIVHTFTVPAPYATDPILAEKLLIDAAKELCAVYVNDAKKHMDALESQRLLDTPSVEPRVSISPVDDKQYALIVRVAIPPKERHRIEQAILRRFMYGCYGQQELPEDFDEYVKHLM